jgi:hypothetical protein
VGFLRALFRRPKPTVTDGQVTMTVEQAIGHLSNRLSVLEQERHANPSAMDRIGGALASHIESSTNLQEFMDAAKVALLTQGMSGLSTARRRRAQEQPRGDHGHFLPNSEQRASSKGKSSCRLCVHPDIKDPTREEIFAHERHNGLDYEANQ